MNMADQLIEKIVQDAVRAELAKVRRRRLILLSFCVILVPVTIWAAAITKPHTFTSGTPAVASEMNANFDTLYTKVNELDGKVAQTVFAANNNYLSTTATIPNNDSLPQNTQGLQVLTASITPRKTTNLIVVSFNIPLASDGGNHLTAALFKDTDANALAASNVTSSNANYMLQATAEHRFVAGTTSAINFAVRVGPNGGTLYMNGQSVGRRYGGALAATLKITEIEP